MRENVEWKYREKGNKVERNNLWIGRERREIMDWNLEKAKKVERQIVYENRRENEREGGKRSRAQSGKSNNVLLQIIKGDSQVKHRQCKRLMKQETDSWERYWKKKWRQSKAMK